ncbi:putative spermidine/putrescine transport system substrate-binding protein [Proteiniborus sp. DW1]|uniref:ABC transporter substrate-binding protein n=1 Tax=Proteiniborus sp. DW1 TaxID=1889883 RepID=UPI00092E0EF8|nr:ABC transporter substrate-binding protein [Proteiniborus sp. DW1]SCG81826.1 putative spermidine/putrescine transport system substrate-binding protein [Proteiniborus sp. DW1]
MKKISLLLVLLMTLSMFMVACSPASDNNTDTNQPNGDASNQSSSGKPTELVISTWGFNEELLRKNIYEPFEKAHNVKIVLEVGNNADRLNKIRLGSSNVDIIQIAEGFAIQAIEEGLFEKIDRSKIPNIENLYDVAKAPFGEDYGPAYTVGRFGIMYDEAKVSKPIESWADLWDESLAKQVTIPDITTTAGPFLPFIVADIEGLDVKADTDAIFDKIKAIDKNLVKIYSKSSEVVNMFSQGEVAAVAGQDFSFGQVKEAVPTAKWVDPKEGAYAVVNTINIVKGTKNKELAEKFIDWILSEEVQKANAIDKVDSPANKNVVLTEEEAEGLTYGAEIIDKLILADWEYINSVNKEWIDRWNKEITGSN